MFEEKSSPTLNSEKSLFRPPAIALLRAVGVPASLTGAAHCITCIKSCVKAAADLWPSEILKQWFAVTVEMEAALQLAPRGNASNLHLFTKSDNVTLQFEQFLHYRQPILSEGQSYEAYGLLGKALLIAAGGTPKL